MLKGFYLRNLNINFLPFRFFQSSSAPESSTSKRRRSEISEALEESFASIDVDAAGKKGAEGAKPRLVREDCEEGEDEDDTATEDWSYKVCPALPQGPSSQRNDPPT